MKIGFIGTGTIVDAMVRGLLASDYAVEAIHVSPRNAEIAAGLAELSPLVHVGVDNQAVVDATELVFLAVRPQIAEEAIRPLTFRAGQRIVSVIAAIEIEALAEWIGLHLPITRAIPLPFVADREGVTAVYPPNGEVAGFFNALGNAVEAKSKKEFDLLAAASTLMGSYFGILETSARWLEREGLSYDQAQAFLGPLFASLSGVAANPDRKTFEELRLDYSTKGGLNEQVHRDFDARGGSDALSGALDKVMARIEGR